MTRHRTQGRNTIAQSLKPSRATVRLPYVEFLPPCVDRDRLEQVADARALRIVELEEELVRKCAEIERLRRRIGQLMQMP